MNAQLHRCRWPAGEDIDATGLGTGVTRTPIAPRLSRLPQARAVGREVRVARGYRARLLGLAFLAREGAGDGLLLERCSSIHTFGMRFRLDVVFLDSGGRIVDVRRDVPSGRVLRCRDAAAVVELPASGA